MAYHTAPAPYAQDTGANGSRISFHREGKMQEREVAASTFPYENTFMGVPVGRPLVYIDSRGRVGIAVNQGNFSKKYGVTPPLLIFIPHKVESNPELSSLRKKVHRYSSLPL